MGNRALRPGANLYLITNPAGTALGRQCRFAGRRGRDGDHRLVRNPPIAGLDENDNGRSPCAWCASPNFLMVFGF